MLAVSLLASMTPLGRTVSASTLLPGGRLWAYDGSVVPADSPMRLWDLSTATVTSTFTPRSGIGAGVAFDSSDGTIWTSTQIPDEHGFPVSDKLIHKTGAQGGADIRSIPDPTVGDPDFSGFSTGAPGLGGLDYDPEEDVLWAIASQPTANVFNPFHSGQAKVYKLRTSDGSPVLTCLLSIQGRPIDTLSVAHPADLGGKKVILTDAGDIVDTYPSGAPLLAFDPSTCGTVKLYFLPVGVTGIDEDPTTHDLIAANSFTRQFYNLGQAPYSTVKAILAAQGPIKDISLEAEAVVRRYTFSGFQQPIDNGVPNTANAGQTIPVKWRLTDISTGAPISDPSSFVSVTSSVTPAACGGSPDAVETYSGQSGLQYLGDGNWQFNWKTPKEYAGQCRTMSLNLADGTTRTAGFVFR